MTSSILSNFSSVGLQLAQQKNASMTTLLSEGKSMASMTYDICTAASDSCAISSIAQRVAQVASTASDAGASNEALGNIRTFAAALQEEGYDTLSIITYLGDAKNLAESDIDTFNKVFSDSDDTTTTLIASIDAGTASEKTDTTGTDIAE
ncbi:hypothetical protein [Desulfobacter vibrioformis]|uniref:hypothetical protein n=1 Tax=Desulfobacter vibrioformis TaxID=34031 RepID=UPI000556F99D|nr:hypothetical protein [Desulfobacter vibrioformis]